MSQNTESPEINIDDEKKTGVGEADLPVSPTATTDTGYADGDDALGLAGARAHHEFDENYFKRLRRKIVRFGFPFAECGTS